MSMLKLPQFYFFLLSVGMKDTSPVGREWVCERAECLLPVPTIWRRVDISGERILTAEFILD